MAFERFGALPAELRIQIWEYAFSEPTVWVATHHYDAGCSPGKGPTHIYKRFIGPEPYLAGLACRESRQLMERSFGKPLRGRNISPTTLGVCWVNLERTFVHLGDITTAADVLSTWNPDETSRFRHVALSGFTPRPVTFEYFGTFQGICQRLATSCPNLHAVIIQPVEGCIEESEFFGPLSRNMANLYAIWPNLRGCISLYLYSSIARYFGERFPRIYFSSPEFSVPSP